MGRFESETNFIDYLRKSLDDNPDKVQLDKTLEDMVADNSVQTEFSNLIYNWEGFAKPYLNFLRKNLTTPPRVDADSVRGVLDNAQFRYQVERDMNITSVYDFNGNVRGDVVEFLGEKFTNPSVTIAEADDILKNFDEMYFGKSILQFAFPLFYKIMEECRDYEMTQRTFYSIINRRIIRDYLEDLRTLDEINLN